MDSAISALTTAVTPATFYAQLTSVAPLVALGLGVGFGFSIIRKVVNGLGKGKAKI